MMVRGWCDDRYGRIMLRFGGESVMVGMDECVTYDFGVLVMFEGVIGVLEMMLMMMMMMMRMMRMMMILGYMGRMA